MFKKLGVTLVLLLGLFCLFGCNVTQPAKISKIAGTYKLKTWNITHYYEGHDMEEVKEKETFDMIAENGVVIYLVITESGNGYYIYKDKDTAISCKAVEQVYDYSTDDNGNPTDKIRTITLQGLEDTTVKLYVQGKKHTFTSNSNAWRSSFHIGKNEYAIGNKDKVEIKYERVSRDQTLNYVEKKVGKLN